VKAPRCVLYTRNLFSSPCYSNAKKESTFWSEISLCGVMGPHGFHLNLAMFTIVEAVIGESVNYGTIVKQQKESTPDDTVEDRK
jgi:hypothetical protein